MAVASVDSRSILTVIAVVAIALFAVYILNPAVVRNFFGISEGFADDMPPTMSAEPKDANMDEEGEKQRMANAETAAFEDGPGVEPLTAEGFANHDPMDTQGGFGNAEGCYPKDQLTPSELLPKDGNSTWAQQNPMGTGSLKGKNFLSAGALIGVNTVGQSLRNANKQLRSEPPNPQVAVSVFNQTTIEPDVNRRTMELA